MTKEAQKAEDDLIQHYRELSETISRDSEVSDNNAEVARETFRAVKANALREAATAYAESGRTQTPGVTDVLAFLHHQADRIEDASAIQALRKLTEKES